MHVVIQIQPFRRKPKKLKSLFSRNKQRSKDIKQITWCRVVSFASVTTTLIKYRVVRTLITAAKETRCKDIYRFVDHPRWGHSWAVWVEACRRGLQTVTFFLRHRLRVSLLCSNKRPYFITLICFGLHKELRNFSN